MESMETLWHDYLYLSRHPYALPPAASPHALVAEENNARRSFLSFGYLCPSKRRRDPTPQKKMKTREQQMKREA
jgi:hypothetical protein